MITNRRGIVPQLDVKDAFDTSTLNTPGQSIAAKYTAMKETIDTIAFADQDTYTLYFP